MSMFTDNLILKGDSYKYSHHKQLPEGTEYISSYIESRGGPWKGSIFFGLQMVIKELLSKPVTMEDIDEAESYIEPHMGPEIFNRKGWEFIVKKYGGILPLRIQAVPEGTLVPTRNAMVQITNTDPEVPWLTSFFETALLRAIWYPTTVATQSFEAKKIIYKALIESSDDPDVEIDFKLHDFGARGVSSGESAAIGGCAHLVNFKGTDTTEALYIARHVYGEHMAGFSIPASEHSTVTSWGRKHEVDAYRNMLKQFAKPGALLANVSDSYDIDNACTHIWGEELREEVIESGAVVIIRPDSGDPVATPIRCIKLLAEKFGVTINSKGYKVLNNVRVIQGDGINLTSIRDILTSLLNLGFSATNIAFGMGGALLQQVNRDTQQFAMKASAAFINGEWREVFKDPINVSSKKSKKGLLKVRLVDDQINTLEHCDPQLILESNCVWRTVWENGVLAVEENLDTIRKRANEHLLASV